MNISLCHRSVWGDLQERPMELIYRSNTMVIGQYIVQNAQMPLVINDVCVLENGYSAACFIEYGKWYITDKFFNSEGHSTGCMVKIATPVTENLTFLTVMDLFIRIWVTPQNRYHLFGTKMFRTALDDKLLPETVEKRVNETMEGLLSGIQDGTFPPDLIQDFKLEKRL